MAKYQCSTGGTVEAIRFDGATDTLNQIVMMIKSCKGDGSVEFGVGDWVVSDSTLDGEPSVYAMKDHEFNEQFTPVVDQVMSEASQLQAFEDELWRLIDRFVDEFDLPLVGAVGVLEVVKHDLIVGGMDKA